MNRPLPFRPPVQRPLRRRAPAAAALATLAALVLAACGGGGGAPGDSPFPAPLPQAPSPGETPPATAQACAPGNPYRGDALEATTQGSLAVEKAWLRAYMGSAYLWNTEIPSVSATLPAFSDPSAVPDSLDRYFQALKTQAQTPAGALRDRFSFTYPTAAWNRLAQAGQIQGNGLTWVVGASLPPRQITVAWVEPGSAAALAGLLRGDVLVSADGISADTQDSASIAPLVEALYPTVAGGSHRYVVRRGTAERTVALTTAAMVLDPVPVAQVLSTAAGRKVGYLLFNDQILTSEAALASAIGGFRTAGVQDLVLDLRYNGGGYLFIASQLAYMVAGPARTGGQVFERLVFNASRAAESASADALTPFYDTACLPDASFRCTQSSALPTLGLPRVMVLTGPGTCSASEAIVNGLRGVGVEVVLVGEATCGKPYGFTPRDNCGMTYFPIEFQGVNAQGWGDYADGMAPTCRARDDLTHALGDPAEGRLAAALYRIDQGQCADSDTVLTAQRRQAAAATGQGRVWATNLSAPTLDGARVVRGLERESRVRLLR